MKARIIFDNLTLEQAMMFASWYEHTGQDSANLWFSEQGIETPIIVDVNVDYCTGDVTASCK